MTARIVWTQQQLLVAFNLYCQIPFGKFHLRNPEIIKYAELIGRTPSALAMKLCNIASLDSEITKTKRVGLKNASAADKSMWEEMQADWGQFATKSQQTIIALGAVTESEDMPDEITDYTGGNKSVQTTARIGQAFFRRSVLSAYDFRCCITGLAVPKLLIASHIVPWRIDVKNRLNPKNGLCLSMLHDKAFDIGIITIAEDMTIKLSREYTIDADVFFKSALLGYEGKSIALPEKFQPHKEFLDYHRQCIFKA
ncbi:MAG: HNH endonuclease [Methylococcaceae bacterium]